MRATGDEFSLADYQRLVELEERDLSDAEFAEYADLCDRFGDASAAVQGKVARQYQRLAASKHKAATPVPPSHATTAASPSRQPQGDLTTGSYFFPVAFLGLFVVVGLGFLIFLGIIPLAQDAKFVPVPATVVSVGEITTDRGSARAQAWVTYEFQGQAYAAVPLTAKVSQLAAPDKTVTIYVNANNPRQIKSSKNAEYAWPVTVIAGCFVGFSLLMQVRLILRAIRAKRIKLDKSGPEKVNC